MTIKSRIEKMEAKHLPKAGAVLLDEPTPESGEVAYQEYLDCIEKARQEGRKVIAVRTSEANPRISGITYAPDRFQGQALLLSETPAEGFASALDRALFAAKGTSLPVVAHVPGGD